MLKTDVMIELHVPDFNIAKEFYGALGFIAVWQRKPEQKKGYLVMRNGESILNFFGGNEHVNEQQYFVKFPKDTVRGYGVEVILPADNITALYENIHKKFPRNVVEPLGKRYSHADFRLIDPFGYYIRVVERYDWVNGRDPEGNTLNK